MNKWTMVLALLGFALAHPAFAQTTEQRGSTPPGMSQDGAKPADGALKGGTILPGEHSGVPDPAKARERCEELEGTLREDCLKQQRDAGVGGTVKPLEERVTEPRMKSPERAD